MKPWKGNALLAWIAAFAFFVAVSWPHVSESALPFKGLRNLTTPNVGWPLALVTLFMAFFCPFQVFCPGTDCSSVPVFRSACSWWLLFTSHRLPPSCLSSLEETSFAKPLCSINTILLKAWILYLLMLFLD